MGTSASKNQNQENDGNDLRVDYYEAESGKETCAVCLVDGIKGVMMPCCGTEGSSISYCRRCLQVLCEHGRSNTASCPTCRKTFTIDKEGNVTNVTKPINRGQCRMCRQQKEIIRSNLCDACIVGSTNALRYECHKCHKFQRIPHPMWRYQETPEKFGSASWACHVACGDYTRWRIAKDDVKNVPSHDIPESWGRSDIVLARVRSQRQLELQGAAESPSNTPSKKTPSK